MTSTNLLPTLWTPLSVFHNDVQNLLNSWENGVARRLSPSYPLVNVWEEAEAYRVEAELPGLRQDEVEVFVTNRDQLTIRGERKMDASLKGSWHRRERGVGRFERVLTLPAAVEADKVEARLENGVLILTLPKAEETRPRRITVKAE